MYYYRIVAEYNVENYMEHIEEYEMSHYFALIFDNSSYRWLATAATAHHHNYFNHITVNDHHFYP